MRRQIGVDLLAEASMAAHCASLYGSVTRGSSCTRVTVITTLNSVLATSVKPTTGAALPGSAVHASGMWPSPASNPDVGSARSSRRQGR